MPNYFKAAFRTLLPITVVLVAPAAWANVSEQFDSGSNGWQAVDLSGDYTAVGGSVTLDYYGSGGNPGGYISAKDPSGGSFYFQAPAAFLGNLSTYQGGKLSFDTFYTPHDSPWLGDPDIVLSNGSTTLFYSKGSNPGETWTHLDISLAPGTGWTVGSFGGAAATASDFTSVLSGATLLRIRGEYYNGVAETTGLDNVVLSAVPEPEVWAAMLVGLSGIGLRVRRRKSGQG